MPGAHVRLTLDPHTALTRCMTEGIMKIEPTAVAAGSLLAEPSNREVQPEETTRDTSPPAEAIRYEDLLPWLLLPMAGAY